MKQEELKLDIQKGNIKKFYILCSDDYFIKSLYVKRIADACGCEVERVDIESKDELKELKRYANTSRLFSKNKKLIHAHFYEDLNGIDILDDFKTVVVLDVVECKGVKNKNLVIFHNPTKEETERFINHKLLAAKKSIERKAKLKIMEAFENKKAADLNMYLDRLFLYVGDESVVRLNHVFDTLDYIPEVDIYKLTECIKLYDKKCFFKVVDRVLNSMDYTYFLNILSLEVIKILSSGYADSELLKTIRLYPSRQWQYKSSLDSLKEKNVLKLLSILYEMDMFLKSTSKVGFCEIFKARMFEWFMQK